VTDVNLWASDDHARAYLQRADSIPRRREGEDALLECVPQHTRRVLDLGSGDGRLLARVLEALPDATGVAVDFSDEMLGRLQARFGTDPRVSVHAHDLSTALPDLGTFDAIVSSFAIHHLTHPRKRALYAEIYARLSPGGVFCNLEHVASATPDLHAQFLLVLGVRPEDDDPSNKLLDVETQLQWLREIGFEQVDCHWKWRELALLAGIRD
jgi:cyclopropane fatty-acyl-phospholipid synthase-like methyltransferase